MDTIRFGDRNVPRLRRAWPEASREVIGFEGYRMIHTLRPGERWIDARIAPRQSEVLVYQDGEVLPVGVVIARELMSEGADWAYCAEVWSGRCILLDHQGTCTERTGPVAEMVDLLIAANGGSVGGFPDVVASRRGRVVLREAKLSRNRDSIKPKQHAFATAAHEMFGEQLDLAVIEWGDV